MKVMMIQIPVSYIFNVNDMWDWFAWLGYRGVNNRQIKGGR